MSWFKPFDKPQAAERQAPPTKKETGALGEKLAADFLKKQGYRILETNYRGGRLGEIDIIAIHKGELVFLEVRTKTGDSFGLPEESITYTKKRRLASLALYYLQSHRGLPESWRVDMVAVELDGGTGKAKRIEIIENALS
ncbi:MAG: YraN family protein [Chloroflexi bacterium]|nr:YraN family protein [Chloroflexota bacterium]